MGYAACADQIWESTVKKWLGQNCNFKHRTRSTRN